MGVKNGGEESVWVWVDKLGTGKESFIGVGVGIGAALGTGKESFIGVGVGIGIGIDQTN
jgi:hypothetical protein